jgi:hypothetical protein
MALTIREGGSSSLDMVAREARSKYIAQFCPFVCAGVGALLIYGKPIARIGGANLRYAPGFLCTNL